MAEGHGSLRLRSGLGRLDRWSRAASQSDKNAAYRALFAVADGTAHGSYEIRDEPGRSQEFSVLVRGDLVITVCLHGRQSFDIVYIGSRRRAPAP
jgi:hypothetical protein